MCVTKCSKLEFCLFRTALRARDDHTQDGFNGNILYIFNVSMSHTQERLVYAFDNALSLNLLFYKAGSQVADTHPISPQMVP